MASQEQGLSRHLTTVTCRGVPRCSAEPSPVLESRRLVALPAHFQRSALPDRFVGCHHDSLRSTGPSGWRLTSLGGRMWARSTGAGGKAGALNHWDWALLSMAKSAAAIPADPLDRATTMISVGTMFKARRKSNDVRVARRMAMDRNRPHQIDNARRRWFQASGKEPSSGLPPRRPRDVDLPSHSQYPRGQRWGATRPGLLVVSPSG